MKKTKLKLEKFTISKLENQHKIFGGTGDDDGTQTQTDTEIRKCIKTSDEYVVIKPVTTG
jgi:hypothetical protein